MAFALAIMIIISNANVASAQSCNGVPLVGPPEQVAKILEGCSDAAREVTVPEGAVAVAAGDNTCRVVDGGANLRSGPGTTYTKNGSASGGQILKVESASGSWLKLTDGNYIYGQLCPQIPPSVYEKDDCYNAQVLSNGDKIAFITGENGEEIQVTVLNTTTDLCAEDNVVWDGAAIRQPWLAPEGQRHPFEVDFAGWWDGAAYFAGISCKLEIDHDKNGATPRLAVFDRDGQTVGYSHGTQIFDMEAGAWYMTICTGTENPGFRINKRPWTDE